ncbi:MAG: hypothetical protein AB7S26_04995 [Sandaracinaceae bacterium]
MGSSQAVLPTSLSVRVICDRGHVLSGLFVIFKLAPPPAGHPYAAVARVMEGTPDPGDEPAEPEAKPASGPPPRRPPKKSAERLRYEDAHAKWQVRSTAHHDTPPDPSTQFVVGFVDDEGYLVPTHDGFNPWYEAAHRDRDPDTYKLTDGETYQACLLRHPDPELARAVARHLNGAATSADAKLAIASWGTLVRDVTVTTKAMTGGDERVIEVSEDPSHYLPPGPSRYGGWSLYLDMPHLMCANVPDQVEKLQEDLAKLRYPTGEEHPFRFRKNGVPQLKTFVVSRALDDRRRFAAGKQSLKSATYMHKAIFHVQSQVAAAIGGFQEHVLARSAFAMSHPDIAFGGGTSGWAYVLGQDFTFAPGSADPRAWTVPSYLYLGCVERHTADALAHWLDQGLRKPGPVMVATQQTGSGVWMQERAAIAVDAWALLLEVFGVKYNHAVYAGSSFRRLVDDPWPGSTKASLHNTGLAVDLAGGGRRHSKAEWPIRFEADWVANRNKSPGAADVVDRGNLDHTLGFKLYAHSELDVFRDPAALTTLRARLATYGDELRRALTAAFGRMNDPQIDTYVAVAALRAIAHATTLGAMTDDELRDQFFRTEVHQFLVNAYEADAGTSRAAEPPTGPAPPDFASVPWAKSWVNISALAYDLGMERISAHQLDVRDQWFLWGDGNKKHPTTPTTISMQRYMREGDPESDLASLLHDIAAPPSEAPENVHYTRPVRVMAGKTLVAEIQPADLRREFITGWRDALSSLAAELRPQQRATRDPSVPSGAQIRLVLSVSPKKKAQLDAAAQALAQFGSERFIVVHAGPLIAGSQVGSIATGAAFATLVRDRQTDFENTVKDRWAEEDRAASGAAPPTTTTTTSPPPDKPKLTREQARSARTREAAQERVDRARDREVAKVAADWTLVLQPLFFAGPAPSSEVPFMPTHTVTVPRSSTPNHLEWWHYQHREAGSSWGDSVAECGLSRAVLGAERMGEPSGSPVTHRGGGYGPDLARRNGSINAGQPRNTFSVPSGG